MCFSYLLLTEAGVSENLESAISYNVVTVSLKPNSVYKKVYHSGPWFIFISSCGFSFCNFQ